MTRLNPADQLAAIMRVQIASLRQKSQAARAGGAKSAALGAPPKDKNADFASLAAERIRDIQPDDPQKRQKAIRVFLESVFLAELGPQLMADPQFVQMVDHVQRQLASHPELAAATQQAADLLLQPSQG
ncbi:MAG TPA: hypothetical protein VLI46_07165 [Ramlibacter sp.]|nr:hypothetical protein [Ramlibacter sp.]